MKEQAGGLAFSGCCSKATVFILTVNKATFRSLGSEVLAWGQANYEPWASGYYRQDGGHILVTSQARAAGTKTRRSKIMSEVKWLDDLEKGLKAAKAQNKPVLLDFFNPG